MRRVLPTLLVLLFIFAVIEAAIIWFAHGEPATAELTRDIATVHDAISEADAEDAKYPGGLIKATIAAQRAVLKTTEAMLLQKKTSILRRIDLAYRVDGMAVKPASEEKLKEISDEIKKMETQRITAQAQAQVTGGLIQTMAQVSSSTYALAEAQLNLAYYSAKYGIAVPSEISSSQSDDVAALAKMLSAGVSESTTSVPSQKEQKVQMVPMAKPAPPRPAPSPIHITLRKKSFKDSNIHAGDFQDAILIELEIRNDSDKDVRAFDGVLMFTDLLDNKINATKLAINNLIGAHGTVTWNGQMNYNQFDDEDRRLRSAEMANMKTVFRSRKVLFADGTTTDYEQR